MLFPSLTKICVVNLSTIDTLFLNQILDFFTGNKAKIIIKDIDLCIQNELEWGNTLQQCEAYKSKFAEIEFDVNVNEYPQRKVKCLS